MLGDLLDDILDDDMLKGILDDSRYDILEGLLVDILNKLLDGMLGDLLVCLHAT